MQYVEKVRCYSKKYEFAEAVELAVEECIKEGTLTTKKQLFTTMLQKRLSAEQVSELTDEPVELICEVAKDIR